MLTPNTQARGKCKEEFDVIDNVFDAVSRTAFAGKDEYVFATKLLKREPSLAFQFAMFPCVSSRRAAELDRRRCERHSVSRGACIE